MIAVKKFLDNIEKYIIYVVLTVLVTLMFGQVVARYVFGLAWGWMEQLTRLLFVYVTFAGMSYACRKSEHLRVSFLAEFLPGKYSRTILFLIGDILMAVVSAYLCYRIFNMMLLCLPAKTGVLRRNLHPRLGNVSGRCARYGRHGHPNAAIWNYSGPPLFQRLH